MWDRVPVEVPEAESPDSPRRVPGAHAGLDRAAPTVLQGVGNVICAMRRTASYLIRLTPTELADLREVAAALERPLAWYIRWCLFKRVPRESVEAAALALLQDASATDGAASTERLDTTPSTEVPTCV